MNIRGDVRLMLIRRGWTADDENPDRIVRKGDLLWAAVNHSGESALEYPGEDRWTINFDSRVPARAIIAACEAATR